MKTDGNIIEKLHDETSKLPELDEKGKPNMDWPVPSIYAYMMDFLGCPDTQLRGTMIGHEKELRPGLSIADMVMFWDQNSPPRLIANINSGYQAAMKMAKSYREQTDVKLFYENMQKQLKEATEIAKKYQAERDFYMARCDMFERSTLRKGYLLPFHGMKS